AFPIAKMGRTAEGHALDTLGLEADERALAGDDDDGRVERLAGGRTLCAQPAPLPGAVGHPDLEVAPKGEMDRAVRSQVHDGFLALSLDERERQRMAGPPSGPHPLGPRRGIVIRGGG